MNFKVAQCRMISRVGLVDELGSIPYFLPKAYVPRLVAFKDHFDEQLQISIMHYFQFVRDNGVLIESAGAGRGVAARSDIIELVVLIGTIEEKYYLPTILSLEHWTSDEGWMSLEVILRNRKLQDDYDGQIRELMQELLQDAEADACLRPNQINGGPSAEDISERRRDHMKTATPAVN